MATISIGRIILVSVAVWLLVIVLMTGPLFHNGDNTEHIAKQLGRAMDHLELLKKQNEEFRALLADFRQIGNDAQPCNDQIYQQLQSKLDRANELVRQTEEMSKQQKEQILQHKQSHHSTGADNFESSLESERVRRRIGRGINEMWFFVQAELKKLQSSSNEDAVKKKVGELLDDINEHKRVLLADFRNFSSVDGRLEWVAKEMITLTDLVQRRIDYLQNPKDCNSARKIVCNLNKGCGYGCQLHHAVYCFLVAYGTRRTLILKSQGWRYNKNGWETVFQPLSNTCTSDYGGSQAAWPGTEETQVLTLPIIDSLHPRPPYLPLSIPKDISARLIKAHGDPAVWWISQFVFYLLRPQEQLVQFLQEMEQKMEFKKPIVGVHVRRTDKVGTEAAFHSIDEYMVHVIDYYKILELERPVPEKRVYLASDDPTVLEDARKKYPDFIFLGDPNIAKSAAVTSRYSDDSLRGIILDIYLLAHTDYLVCTFSSQVCRVAYEVMQTLHPDASSYFYSLDDIYYFGGQNAHNQRVLYGHHPREGHAEISLEKGDVVGIAGNHWDGFSRGVNRRTNQEGLYPSFKAEDILDIVDMPTYDEVHEANGAE